MKNTPSKNTVFFPDTQGNSLCAILSEPKENELSPIVILCHGFTTSKDSTKNQTFEKLFNACNIATIRIDFFGHGESDGNFEEITLSKAKDDILSTIQDLTKIGYTKIGLVGSSFGGMSSILACAQTDALCCLALTSPVSNYHDKHLQDYTKQELLDWKNKGYIIYENGKGEKMRLNYTFFLDAIINDGYVSAKDIKVPTLIVHGEKDTVVPIEQSRKLVTLLQAGKLIEVSGEGHKYKTPENFEKMIDLIFQFTKERLLNL
ncbi:MAG: hypothetical protein COV59_04000 [Candidatus Magasanikbacteria bacterium CG11_big_fil_rev_8_21_14_0_20_39_34]|uniref:Peptidase S9 prolyl oligopeptidase catalytic domain-containing protein n=1 Tax=Candidatus Magasanikbacteria bacterium CG11_big_fil_rev_8_21_14_0_20_39_34 TaxID=1974653 RepID=A0A2H0N4I4_9BACT|nr:MAG: hypothetical protein COV59_04000 [Candidatus Magasanikbacteria bacterium CG11_big_fil_rev_8_21_14_0_20_39_34]